MTERISSPLSGGVCRHPDDEQVENLSRENQGAPQKRQLSSEAPSGWDDVASSCEANAVLAARHLKSRNNPGSSSASTPSASEGSKAPPRSEAPKPKGQSAGASSNAARTAERDGVRPYFAAGLTHDAHSAFAGGAAAKGTARGVVAAEAVSLSVEAGLQNEAQGAVARVGVSGDHVSATLETLTVQAHAGVYNADGSVGFNYGASANFVSSELTAKYSGNSVKVGLAAGIGVGMHAGLRDDDGDGRPELCAGGAIGSLNLGVCLEVPFVLRP